MPNRYDLYVKDLRGKLVGDIYGKQPIHVTETEMQQVEQELGASLPGDYREFISDYGHYAFYQVVRFPVEPNSAGINHGILQEIYGAVPSWQNDGYGLVAIYRSSFDIPVWQSNWLPIAEAGRDDRLVLSIAGEDKGAVYLFVDHLWDSGEQFLFHVADSFDEFMQLLYIVPKN